MSLTNVLGEVGWNPWQAPFMATFQVERTVREHDFQTGEETTRRESMLCRTRHPTLILPPLLL